MMQSQQHAVHECASVYGPTKETGSREAILKKLKKLIRFFSRENVKDNQRKASESFLHNPIFHNLKNY